MDRRTNYAFCEGGSVYKTQTNNIKPIWKQIFVVSGACNVCFSLGLALGTNTVAIPQMKKEGIEVTEEMRSWLGGIFGYGAFFWIWILTPMINYLGVRKTYMFVCLSPFLGSTVIYFAKTSVQVFLGQAIQSLMQGAFTNVSIMVLTEYVSPDNRSMFLTLKTTSVYWGIWLANAIGTFFYWRYIAVISMICSLYGVTLFFWPESPFWLASKGRFEECSYSFRWSRETNEDAEKELKTLIANNSEEMVAEQKLAHSESNTSWWKILTSKRFYKPLLLGTLLYVSNMSSGKLPCTVYAIEIFTHFTTDTKMAYTAMLILDGVNVAGMYCGCYLSKKMPRRTMAFGGLFTGLIILFFLAIHGFLVHYEILNSNLMISLVALSILLLVLSAGPAVLIGTIQSELVPVENRVLYCLIFTLTGQFVFGSFLKITPYLFNLGDHIAFLTFAIISTVSHTFLFFKLPETKGKTYHEINNVFQNKNNSTTASARKLLRTNEP